MCTAPWLLLIAWLFILVYPPQTAEAIPQNYEPAEPAERGGEPEFELYSDDSSARFSALSTIRNLVIQLRTSTRRLADYQHESQVGAPSSRAFSECVSRSPGGYYAHNRARFRFAVEGETVRLPCTNSCGSVLSSSAPSTTTATIAKWMRVDVYGSRESGIPVAASGLAFFGRVVVEASDLVIYDPPGSTTASYYCYFELPAKTGENNPIKITAAVWTVEVAGRQGMTKVPARDWRRNITAVGGAGSPYQPSPPIPILDGSVIVEKTWTDWSKCRDLECGDNTSVINPRTVGKRHRVQVCNVSPREREGAQAFESFTLYSTTLSCSAFLLFHPDALTTRSPGSRDYDNFEAEQDEAHVLSGGIVVVVGYCGTTGAGCGDVVGSRMVGIYKSMEMIGGGSETFGDSGTVIRLMGGLVNLPVGWKYLPEMAALVVVVGIQVYVVVVLCSGSSSGDVVGEAGTKRAKDARMDAKRGAEIKLHEDLVVV